MKNSSRRWSHVKYRAIASAPVSFTLRQSNVLSGTGYSSGNVILMIKDGLAATFDTAAGACFCVCSTGLYFTKRWPVGAFRVVGGACMAASVLLGADALNIGRELPVNWGKLGGAVVQSGVSALLLFQKEIADYSLNLDQKSKTVFNRVAASMSRYPVMWSAALDFAAGAGLMIGAFMQTDRGMQAAMIGWSAGLIGLVASDPRLQQAHSHVSAVKRLYSNKP